MNYFLKILVVWIIFPILSIFGFLLVSRTLLYDYDVALDYSYPMDEKNALTHTINIQNGRVDFPDTVGRNHSSFLKVNVSSGILGKMFQPAIQMFGKNDLEVQYTEHGANGTRYLNITNLVASGNTQIRLHGTNIDIANGETTLYQFENVELENKTVLIIAPHPDDAEIAAFGLYSNHDDVYIATVTSGDAGPFMYDEIYDDPVTHYLKKGEVRTWNSLVVPILGGVDPERIVNLGYNDARLRKMEADREYVADGLYTDVSDMDTFRRQNFADLADGLVGINNWESLVGNMRYLLNEIEPDIIITASPKLDQHSDHQYSTHALIEALKAEGINEGQLLLYTNHLVPFNENYPYGNAGGVISVPPTPRGPNYYNGIYSYPMTVTEQQGKILALDAMNDLRLGTDFRYPLRAFAQSFETLWNNMIGDDQTYFRRAIRSNEFFFVVNISEIYDDEKLKTL
ncbi:PIG-L deacetylase family protein [Pseudemcibacter aquimaris]|uniref:PIG-L deacetylase family protein n=1 Tax=Pseudemcibacter aquimaris TaxID=2857064 RepID=UPI0020114AA0|nr:PIG-L family deacetylase [Pseudemcibacter aquimaris]MCC3861677.1 PIG-L family deacetylase [Pseudemcibacter aquimaris]WDU58448.1 PIG-L family deacetylase [Pseudemcibacter aquimaris]